MAPDVPAREAPRYALSPRRDRVIGTCGLCQETRKLRESHLIPAAIYKIARDPDAPPEIGKDPAYMSPRGTVQTSHQIKAYFLCEQCENRFSDLGERTATGECSRRDGGFRLRERLRESEPSFTELGTKWYSGARVPGVDSESYRYFAASMVWRTSAGPWREPGWERWRLSLGTKYQEAFRSYLLGASAFPSQALLALFVADDEDPLRQASVPLAKTEAGFHLHNFFIPGIEFRLYLGGAIDSRVRALYAHLETSLLLILHESRSAPSTRQLAQALRTSELKGKLARRITRGNRA